MQLLGFYKLYSIDVRSKDDSAKSGRGRRTGLKSPFGHRGAVLAHFGWTWEYLLWGVRWNYVQKMMIDAPGYEFENDEDDQVSLKKKTKTNERSLRDFMNSAPR